MLDTIARLQGNLEALKGKIKKALFYPAVVIAVAILVSAILLIFVVPQFEGGLQQLWRAICRHSPDDRQRRPGFMLSTGGCRSFLRWSGGAFVLAFETVSALQHWIDRLTLEGAGDRQDHAQLGHCPFPARWR